MLSERSKILEFMIATNKLDELYYSIGRQLGINENEFILFYALSDGKAHTQRGICEEWFVPRSTVNSVTKKLVSLGYIELVPTGHKEKELVLTEAGRDYTEKAFPSVFEAENRAFAETIGKYADEATAAILKFTELFEKNFTEISKENKHV